MHHYFVIKMTKNIYQYCNTLIKTINPFTKIKINNKPGTIEKEFNMFAVEKR